MTVEGLLPSRAQQINRDERLQLWAGRLASAVAAFMLISSAVMKIMAAPETVATHLRIGDPFLVPLVIGLLVWAGLSLRSRRVRPLWVLPRKEPVSAADTFTHQPTAA